MCIVQLGRHQSCIGQCNFGLFGRPSAALRRAIRPILDGRDAIGQVLSGTGNAATFAAGALQRIDYGSREREALILAPTRELAQQIQKVASALVDYRPSFKFHVRTDGTALRDGQHLVVGTPDRVWDMMSKGHLRVEAPVDFALDEADEMLSTGFKQQVYDIFRALLARRAGPSFLGDAAE